MKLLKTGVLAFSFLCALVFEGTSIVHVQASSVHFNKVPKILRGVWESKEYKKKRHNDSHIYFLNKQLIVHNKEFHLEDFVSDEHKNRLFNSGPYGSFAGNQHKLAFRKISNRHYMITGDYQAQSDEFHSGYRVLLSKNHKSMKVYRYTKVKRPGYVTGHQFYVGYFKYYRIPNPLK